MNSNCIFPLLCAECNRSMSDSSTHLKLSRSSDFASAGISVRSPKVVLIRITNESIHENIDGVFVHKIKLNILGYFNTQKKNSKGKKNHNKTNQSLG